MPSLDESMPEAEEMYRQAPEHLRAGVNLLQAAVDAKNHYEAAFIAKEISALAGVIANVEELYARHTVKLGVYGSETVSEAVSNLTDDDAKPTGQYL